ncbi:radical SAM protein [Sphingomonas glaciei]|uniref:Radical SAM protein n=1 Tax=Sphingomonas glaciei TaxID=2938948 RepID=A0ABY5MUU3_9SPHN|nr:radical SAM protein [Sphingomonas glaciei]UUR08217.1 radical SAM protein [Sphingomonas glaciei]
MNDLSPFAVSHVRPLDPAKFRDPLVTARGEARAEVAMTGLATLWINTGTLCNLACRTCYIESSPRNDALVYISLAEAEAYLDEALALGTREIGFTGGEPFMNPDMIAMLGAALERGFEVLMLTNAMRPMQRFEADLLDLQQAHGERLTMRVSLDHYSQPIHEAERGPGTWDKAIAGARWLSDQGFRLAIAGRQLPGEDEAQARDGYAALFEQAGLKVDAGLVVFPEMDATADVPEITTACWDILGKSPDSIMCASSRMVVKRKGGARPVVAACTLIPYDPQFTMGDTLAEASRPVRLNHPHCARFCVLGGASCSA